MTGQDRLTGQNARTSRRGRSLEERQGLEWLESHTSLEHMTHQREAPTLDRMWSLMALLGDPQTSYPVIHVTGTNGKGSTTRLISTLLSSTGLSVGTYSSPDLEGVHERLMRNGEAIDEGEFAALLAALARVERSMQEIPSRFELLTAAAFRWFADIAVDVAVVEVGLGGLFDATNVADGTVAVVTNVSLDHTDILGPTESHIAKEKAGIIKPGSTLILGDMQEELVEIFTSAGAEKVWSKGTEFGVESSALAVGGRVVSLRSRYGFYPDLYLALHGGHQATNACVALAAVEAFFDAALPLEVVQEAFASVSVPGRMEVAQRRPLVLLDGAHNVEAARALALGVSEEFGDKAQKMVVVLGLLQGRDPGAMLDALGTVFVDSVIACAPDSPRAIEPTEVAAAASIRGLRASISASVGLALEEALAKAGPQGMVLVTGSLYLVGEARSILAARDGS